MKIEELERLLKGIDFLENIIGGIRIERVGVFDNFLIVQFTNGIAFVMPKDIAPKPVDKGRYYVFENLPERIRDLGIDCKGYYAETDDLVVLISPITNCRGSIDIEIPQQSKKMSVADVWQASLFSMLDKKEGFIEYKGRIVGCLSLARTSPLARIALKKLEDLIRAGAKFVIKDEKTIVTAWRTRIEFGVKPIPYNPVKVDFDRVKQELSWRKIGLDNEIEKIRIFFTNIDLDINELLLKCRKGAVNEYGKVAVVKGNLEEYKFVIAIGKYVDDYIGSACIDDSLSNLALLLITSASDMCLEEKNKSLSREELRIKEMEELERFLTSFGILANLLVPGCKIFRVRAREIDCYAIVGKKGEKALAIVVTK
ncbi:MAG: hypothetical protein ACTSX9_09600 [Candidatus Njordarchaeales archaeon]